VLLGLAVRYGRAVFVWSWLHVPVLAFLAANVAATVFAVDPLLALYGAHTRMIGLGTIADCVLLYFAIACLVRGERDLLVIAGSFLAGSVLVLTYEFVQLFGKDPLSWSVDPSKRPFSTIGQTTNLAEYLTVVAAGAAALAIFQKDLPVPARVVLVLYSGLAIAGTVVTQTRSAFLGLVAGAGVLVALTWTRHPARRARVVSIVGAAGAVAGLAIVLFATPLGARFLNTVETTASAESDSGLRLEESADTRAAIYRLAFDMFRDRLVFGVGPDNFLASVPRFRSDSEPPEIRSDPTSSAHGWLTQVAATSGAVGLASFLAIPAVAVFLTVSRGFRPDAWAALGMLSAFLGTSLTTVNAIATDWLFWAAAGALVSTTAYGVLDRALALVDPPPKPSRRSKSASARPQVTAQSIIAYACLAIGFAIALTALGAVDASRAAKASQLVRLQGQSQPAIDLGLRATRADSLRPQYWHTLGLAYVSGARFGDAVTAFERASKLAPYDVRYDGDLARALAALVLRGDNSASARAREVADRVVRTDPNNPLAHQTRAVVLQALGNLPEAMASAERALTLDARSTNDGLYVTATQIYIDSGKAPEALRVARGGIAVLGATPASVPLRYELARALLANRQPSDALAELDIALAIQPGYVPALQLRAEIRVTPQN
jgi:O-antigen ligase